MTDYIATFHTHHAAARTYRTLTDAGVSASLAPVPRALSADCGTCVRFLADTPCESFMHRDYERIVTADDYATVAENAL